MKPSEKYGLAAGAGMLAMLAFQNAVDTLSENFIETEIQKLEQRDDRVVLSPKYGDMLTQREDFKSPDTGFESFSTSTLGQDKNKQKWLCQSQAISTNGQEFSIAWKLSNDKAGDDEKIAFPKSSCIQFIEKAPNTIPQETPKPKAPSLYI